jgi:hypothetical protein
VRWREGGKNKGRIFSTRKDALDFEAEVRRKKRLGDLGMLDHGRHTVQELHDEWYEVHTESLSRATVEAYDYAWERLVEPKLGKYRLSEVTPQRIEKYHARAGQGRDRGGERREGVGDPLLDVLPCGGVVVGAEESRACGEEATEEELAPCTACTERRGGRTPAFSARTA